MTRLTDLTGRDALTGLVRSPARRGAARQPSRNQFPDLLKAQGAVRSRVASPPAVAVNHSAATSRPAALSTPQAAARDAQANSPSAEPAGLAALSNQVAVEAGLNNYLMRLARQQNELRMIHYNNAVEGWRNTNTRNRDLGLPEVPPPPPAELEVVAPMPEGWWFLPPGERT